MANGFRRLVINSQERAVSTDINRLQAFMAQEIAEIFRNMLDVYVATDDNAIGAVSEPAVVESPLRAEILQGLMVQPQGGTLGVNVSAGVGFFLSPDSAPDESNYKYIRDGGTTGLAIGANAAGSARIDVIECQISAIDALVTDSRDVFNTSTGLFAATTVTKERRGVLTYRVRAGVAGAGWPGTASGWLPLAVACVPAGAASVDVCTFWDVRPLVGDRVHAPFALAQDVPVAPTMNGEILFTGGASSILTGHARAAANGLRLGGRLRRGSPGADADTIDLTAAANCESAFAYSGVTQAIYYLYLLTPFGLPRWARYTDGPANRVPRSPKGIPLVSAVPPSGITGAPSAAITFPSTFGFGASTTTKGVCIASFVGGLHNTTTTSGAFSAYFADKAMEFGNVDTATTYLPNPSLAAPDANTIRATLVPGTHFPANAKRIKLSLGGRNSVNAGQLLTAGMRVRTWRGLAAGCGAQEQVSQEIGTAVLANPTAGVLNVDFGVGSVWVNVPQKYPSAPTSFEVDFFCPIGTLVAVAGQVKVIGWEL